MDILYFLFLFIWSVVPIIQIVLLAKEIKACTEEVAAEVVGIKEIEARVQRHFGPKRYKAVPVVKYETKDNNTVINYNKMIKVPKRHIWSNEFEKNIMIKYDPNDHEHFIIPDLISRRILKHLIELFFIIIAGILVANNLEIGIILFVFSNFYFIIIYMIHI